MSSLTGGFLEYLWPSGILKFYKYSFYDILFHVYMK